MGQVPVGTAAVAFGCHGNIMLSWKAFCNPWPYLIAFTVFLPPLPLCLLSLKGVMQMSCLGLSPQLSFIFQVLCGHGASVFTSVQYKDRFLWLRLKVAFGCRYTHWYLEGELKRGRKRKKREWERGEEAGEEREGERKGRLGKTPICIVRELVSFELSLFIKTDMWIRKWQRSQRKTNT